MTRLGQDLGESWVQADDFWDFKDYLRCADGNNSVESLEAMLRESLVVETV